MCKGEDDVDTRELIGFVLMQLCYDVICSTSNVQAIDQFDFKTPVLFYSGAAYESDREDFAKVPAREKAEVLAAFAAHKDEVAVGYKAKCLPTEDNKTGSQWCITDYAYTVGSTWCRGR